MSGSQYITLVLRSLGYAEAEPETAAAIAYKSGLLLDSEADEISSVTVLDRDKMVYVSFRALTADMYDGGTLIEKLINDKVINADIAVKLGVLDLNN